MSVCLITASASESCDLLCKAEAYIRPARELSRLAAIASSNNSSERLCSNCSDKTLASAIFVKSSSGFSSYALSASSRASDRFPNMSCALAMPAPAMWSISVDEKVTFSKNEYAFAGFASSK